ncbi:MAG: plastocyanin/azurin family copper-binding protein [Candidatus Limnocylindrales bacterium]|nr:plastocyanin/azurin family copper-binding protein [Candidatus Limnocylindrales bacterium]
MAAHKIRRDRNRRSVLAATAIAGLMLLTIGSVNAATVTVAAVNFEFQPESRTVMAGDVVRWTFAGEPHTVTSGTPGAPDGGFDSGIKDPGGSFQLTFDSAGTFRYFCQIHSEQMVGTIVVSAAATPAPSPTPNASPTPKPTAKPTTRPTATPTAAPTAATEAPTTSPSPAPTAEATKSPSVATAAPTTSPTASPGEAASGPGAAVSGSPGPSVAPEGGDAAAALDAAPILAGAIVVGLLVAGGVAAMRRGRRL